MTEKDNNFFAVPPYPTKNPDRARTWIQVINARLAGRNMQLNGVIWEEDFDRMYPGLAKRYVERHGPPPAELAQMHFSSTPVHDPIYDDLRKLRDALVDHFDIPADGS